MVRKNDVPVFYGQRINKKTVIFDKRGWTMYNAYISI